MSATTRPITPEDLRDAGWDQILPFYEHLAERPLDDPNAWLAEWSAFEEVLGEARAFAYTAYTGDTTDPAKEEAHLRFASQIAPRAEEQEVRLGRRLLESGYTRPDLEPMLARQRNQDELFRAESVPLVAELQQLASRWQKLVGGLSADWDGRRLPLPALRGFEASPDRSIRERAYRKHFAPYVASRDEIATIFDRMLELRQQVAHNAGFANYRDYAHLAKNRFSYSVEDCQIFQEAAAGTVVPAVTRILERRRQAMGLDALRPWDAVDGHCGVADAHGRPALKPFRDGDELAERSVSVFGHVDPVFGGYFGTMRSEQLLDLESRPGKAPGGYCTSFPHRKRPFIFVNGTGTEADVRTILHEAGHAFHSFEAFGLPVYMQRHPGSEMAEVASMSMELLAAPYIGEGSGGFYSPDEERQARTAHLEGLLFGLAHIASVDAMQHWIYTDPAGADRDARDRKWLELRARFQPGVDWTGLEDLRVARWLAQPHFFTSPFYYIEYGIAQLGALQVWRNSLSDQAGAVAAYRDALALGGTRTLPELFSAAGAHLVFDVNGMAELVGLVEDQIAQLA
jgi:oligoendopeptidase F